MTVARAARQRLETVPRDNLRSVKTGPIPLPPPALRIADLNGKRVGIWGAGREGSAALRALVRHAPDASSLVVTSAPPSVQSSALASGTPASAGPAVPWLFGPDGIEALAACDVVIRSPGVPVRGPEADRVRAGGAILTTGTALWLAERVEHETVIGVTGTKGKSTTASLLHHLLGKAGIRSQLAGNIGRPLLDELVPANPPEVWVVELSSYQLADLPRAPTVAVVTNLLRDHVPWHGDEATYHADKLRILTAEADAPAGSRSNPRLAVLSYADPALREAAASLRCPILWVDHPDGLHVADGQLLDGPQTVCSIDQLPLRGVIGARNASAALESVRALGYEIPDLAAALRDFEPLPHRQQVVAERAGHVWVDDSISTTPEAALAAVAAFGPGPVVLLAGGDHREQHYDALASALASGQIPTGAIGEPPAAVTVAGLVTLPGTGPALADAVQAAGTGLAVRRIEGSEPGAVMDAAVAAARQIAPPGATILLSPAAPSHNVFRDFEDRGDRFAAAVAALPDDPDA